jgi:membrane-associated phospholipid phosphatase
MQGHTYTAAAMPPVRPRIGRREKPGVASALGVAGLCLLAAALVWALADMVPAAQFKDALALQDFTRLSRPGVDTVANFLLRLLDPREFILWGIALVAVALARERPRVALAVIAVMALAPLTAETLKPLVAHPHVELGAIQVGAASWPSGHATAARARARYAVLVAPPRLRVSVAVVGGLFALAVGCSLLILAWHMPSDVLGGYLVATFWAALAVAALRAADRRWPPRISS